MSADPTLDPDALALRREVLARAASQATDAVGHDAAQSFDRTGWDGWGEFGLLRLPVPTALGGCGRSLVQTVTAWEALGEACADNGLTFALGAHLWACTMPLLDFGSPEQHARHLPGMLDGRTIAAHAASEPSAGSDVFALRTTAVRRGDTYVVSGTKTYITNAPIADLLLVLATVDPDRGSQGVTAFLIDAHAAGVEISPPVSKMGMRSAPMGEIRLTDVEVPVADRLGAEGAGASLFSHGMEFERAFILAPALGAMQRLLDRTVRHARTRRQFDRPIGEFQAVGHQIAGMQRAVETSRALLYRTAGRKDAGKRIAPDAALVKLHLSESWVDVAQTALQLHGASGYVTAGEIERDVRDALGSRLYSGTSEIQLDLIARYLGL
jgi:alkylation response protein AidB-like acyl-CoA dehydrogenase